MPTLDEIRKDSAEILKNMRQIVGQSDKFLDSLTEGSHTVKSLIEGLDRGPLRVASKFLNLETSINKVKNSVGQNDEVFKELIVHQEEAAKGLRAYYEDLENLRSDDKTLKSAKKELDLGENLLKLRQLDLRIKQTAEKTNFRFAGVLLTMAANSVRLNKSLNRSLRETVSLQDQRLDIMKATTEMSIRYGVSLSDSAASAAALSAAGFEAGDAFQRNLDLSIMMREGLGVSVENTAELARIYETSLKSDTREVADSIASIADNTAIAADEAARYAIEIGKSVSALGPGMGEDASAVSKYLSEIEGQMHILGGDKGEIIKLYQKALGGDAEALKIRGLVGITSPGQLAGEEGAHKFVEGLDRLIKNIVTAGAGSDARGAQQQAVSNLLSMSYLSVAKMREALEAHQSLTLESITIDERFNNQIRDTGESVERLWNGLQSLAHRGLMPLLSVVNTVVGTLSNMVHYLVDFPGMIAVAVVGMTVAVGYSAFAVGRMSFALYLHAKQLQRNIFLQNTLTATLAKNSLMTGRLSTAKNPLIKTLIGVLKSPLVARSFGLLGAAAAGWTLGRLLDKHFFKLADTIDLNAINRLKARNFGRGVSIPRVELASAEAARRDILETAFLGSNSEILEKIEYWMGPNRVGGLMSQKLAVPFMERILDEVLPQARYSRRSTSVSGDPTQNDSEKKILDLMKELSKNSKALNRIMELSSKKFDKAKEVEKVQRDADRKYEHLYNYDIIRDSRGAVIYDFFMGLAR